MTTYNSYEAAKIANPESEICKLASGYIATNEPQGVSVHKCNPADYCMTVEKFLADGHKFVEGDIVIDDGEVAVIDCEFECTVYNDPDEGDSFIYILRAAALEERPIEKIEWDGEGLPPVGVECEAVFVEHEHKGYGEFLVLGYHSNYVWMEYVGELSNKSKHYTSKVDLVKFRKPETKQQREGRERLEAAYDLFCHVQVVNNRPDCGFESFELYERSNPLYTLMVDKTNYRISK